MTAEPRPLGFAPTASARDPIAAYWIEQAQARLRRELAWAWHERGGGPGDPGRLPPYLDAAGHSVTLLRRADEKRQFFLTDPAARYLSTRLDRAEPAIDAAAPRGSFGWVARALDLAPVERFWLGLVLCAESDRAAASVIAACANEPGRARPTLALAQLLWDEPAEVAHLDDLAHPLHRVGLVAFAGAGAAAADRDAAASVPSLVVAGLLGGDLATPAALESIAGAPRAALPELAAVVHRLGAAAPPRLQVVRIAASRGDGPAAALALATAAGRRVLRVRDELAAGPRERLDALATWAWLAGVDLFLPAAFVIDGRPVLPRESIPITVHLDTSDHARVALPDRLVAVTLTVPAADHAARVATWTAALGERADGAAAAISEGARRFRYGQAVIERLATTLPPGPITLDGLTAACRLELRHDFGDLAERLEPRFTAEELVLPPAERRAFHEIVRSMRALTEVHHGWGTARAWSSAGISVLFAGPSGTGKTMAAECLASALDLPLYRVDVSQVVDKYVGETEKNLRRIFDAAEVADCVLFLDEAEAIFGRRMESRTAQDRWANLEISYLLTRMESAKGLTILATNRRDELDGAFLRRLRHVLEFPPPDADGRLRIWRQHLPPGADASALELELLARRFALTGGQIRSIVFNASLQCAGGDARRLTMDAVVVAIWRELQKQDRDVGLGQFGPLAPLIKELERT